MGSSYDCSSAILFCGEDNQSILDLDEREAHIFHGFLSLERHHPHTPDFPSQPLSNECFQSLVLRQRHHRPQEAYFSKLKSGSLDSSLRRDAIDWISKVHAHYNFGPLSFYLSVNYLDRFLSLSELPRGKAWMIQLLSVACLSLAAKMEETEVPLSLDLQVADARFVFEARTIQRMELLVLSTLQWRMQAVTPFSFLDLFLRRFNGGRSPPDELISRSVHLVLKMISEIDFLEFEPAEIAAATAAVVADEQAGTLARSVDLDDEKLFKCLDLAAETSEELAGTVALSIDLDKGKLQRCADLVRELAAAAERNVDSGSAPAGSVPRSPIGVLDAACLSYKSDGDPSGVPAIPDRISPNPKRRKIEDQTGNQTES